jgi:hypothetical protein
MFNNVIFCFSGLFEANACKNWGWRNGAFKDDVSWSSSAGDYLFSKCFNKGNRAYWNELGDTP